MSFHRAALVLGTALLLCACGEGAIAPGTDLDDLDMGALALTSEEKQLVVDALNDSRTTLSALSAAGVASAAAANLINHRDGADKVAATADDDRYDTYAEVDMVPQVGTATLAKLLGYARWLLGATSPPAGGGIWESVAFSAEEAAGTLRAVNGATEAQLTGAAGVTSTAARNLVAAQPIDSMDELAAVPSVGTATLARLRAWASAAAPARPDLNTMTAAQLEACDGVGPIIAAAIVEYRSQYGRLENHEEVKALPTLGWRLVVSDAVVAGLRSCSSIPGERRYVRGATIRELLERPADFAGAEVLLLDVVMSANLSSSTTRALEAFDFSAWGYADWYAAAVPRSAHIALVVETAPEMYRRDSTRYLSQRATDTRLNRVNLQAAFDLLGGVPTLRVRSSKGPGRDLLQVDQRWVDAPAADVLASLWSRENGVLRKSTGAYVNRIHADLLNAHPAVLWHERTRGEAVNIGQTTECYDCSANAYTIDGQNLFAQYVDAWIVAGKP
ncbi:MAG: helix-hairpin-helix domain-containing protein [Deltaproteobacteria bacterium]|nr:helix-hairpin-helix domain-containing protein [Deltaproteobacteria bacterium]